MRNFKILDEEAVYPTRATTGSAGYDLRVLCDKPITIRPGETHVFRTGIAVEMDPEDVFIVATRSSIGVKKHLIVSQSLGVIDSDYFPREILVPLTNIGIFAQVVENQEKVAQGIFIKYLTINNEREVKQQREGGFGSTEKVAA